MFCCSSGDVLGQVREHGVQPSASVAAKYSPPVRWPRAQGGFVGDEETPRAPPPRPRRARIPRPRPPSWAAVHTIEVGLRVPNPIGIDAHPTIGGLRGGLRGMMPRVFAPSVSSTTISGAKVPAGLGAAGTGEAGGRAAGRPWPATEPGSAGATAGLISAIASTDLRMAAPMVVPRPVVSESIARSSGCRSVVGATASWANPENRTRPMLVSGVLGLHEVAHRSLRRGQPVGLDVGGAHGARHIQRQDHRGLRDRHLER